MQDLDLLAHWPVLVSSMRTQASFPALSSASNTWPRSSPRWRTATMTIPRWMWWRRSRRCRRRSRRWTGSSMTAGSSPWRTWWRGTSRTRRTLTCRAAAERHSPRNILYKLNTKYKQTKKEYVIVVWVYIFLYTSQKKKNVIQKQILQIWGIFLHCVNRIF